MHQECDQHDSRIGAAHDPVIGGLERDRAFLQPPLEALVPVDAELGFALKVHAELDEAGPEIVVHKEGVAGVDHRRAVDKLRGGPAGG